MGLYLMSEDNGHSLNELDEVTRERLKDNSWGNDFGNLENTGHLIDKVTALAFVLGVITGIIIASYFHNYIVHPLGY